MMPEWDAIHQDDFKLAIALDSGDTETVDRMTFENQRGMVEDALSENFDTSIKTGGAVADRGKLQAKAKQIHGLSNSPESINGYMMTFDSMKNGSIRDDVETANDAKLREAARAVLSPAAISNLAKPGLRDGVASLSDENRIGRSEDRVVDYNSGVDRNTGALIAGMPTDGGHGDNFPHEKFPEYSDARWNMGTEQGYINKTKGNRTGQEAMEAMRNGLRNKMHADESGDVIRSVANGWQVGEGYGAEAESPTQPLPKSMRDSLRDQDNESIGRDKNNKGENSGDNEKLTINNNGSGTVHIDHGIEDNVNSQKRQDAKERTSVRRRRK